MKLTFALLAALVLLVMDYLLAVAVFYGRTRAGEVFIVAMLLCILATILLRRRWMVYATQNLVTLLVIGHVAVWGLPRSASDTAAFLTPIVLGNFLAWVIARAMPRHADAG